MMVIVRTKFFFFLGLGGLLLLSCTKKLHSGRAEVGSVKGVFSFNSGTVVFKNNFAGARMNEVVQENDSSFSIKILPENEPINPSPWYAFKVYGKGQKRLQIRLDYPVSKHRYSPKIKHGDEWIPVEGTKVAANEKSLTFALQSVDTILVAAQEVMSSREQGEWLKKLPAKLIRTEIIGHSLGGKPITAFSTGGSNGKKLVVVLSRQHPPEVTGYMAMQAFVEKILDQSELSKQFRKKYELVVIPFINPDGVDLGYWRHSLAGVDLNRDWQDFKQPETRAVRDFLLKKLEDQGAVTSFGIDFHSTYQDVLYTNEDQPGQTTSMPGLTKRWIEAMSQAIPGFVPSVKPSPNGGNVSKSWMGRVLKAEALTYEVGDDTPRAELRQKGVIAAQELMRLLLAN